jgi:hypothetical protein
VAKKKALTKKKKSAVVIPSSYHQALNDIKARIHEAQAKAFLSVNQELIKL